MKTALIFNRNVLLIILFFTLTAGSNLLSSEIPVVKEVPVANDDVVRPTEYTARTNARYLSPTGSDKSDGKTRATAWRTLRPNLSSIPDNTEVIFMDGIHDYKASLLWGEALPNNITFRADNYRLATLRGPASQTSEDGEIAVYLDGQSNFEFYGLNFDRWAGAGAGLILIENHSKNWAIKGCKFTNSGTISRHHHIYLSGGTAANGGHHDWVIEGNESVLTGLGNFVQFYSSKASTNFSASNGKIRNNTVTGEGGTFILISNTRAKGQVMNILIEKNIVIGKFHASICKWTRESGKLLNGVDSSFIVRNNHFENTSVGKDAYVYMIYPLVTTAEPFLPTVKDNVESVAHPSREIGYNFNNY